ncbi:hypothetical protein JXB01_04735 [Candidatus Micrarchaeota archaeon]|nr:hypothetical protein [Candidatus Micrarchaeota archaeon]
MKSKLFILLIMIILGSVYSAECNKSFSEDLTIRILDSKFRGLEGAEVQVTYQIDATKDLFTTPFKETNENGRAFFKIANQEDDEELLDCDITVYARFGSQDGSKTIVAQNHLDPVDFYFDAYRMTVIVRDHLNNPLEGASVWVNDVLKKTDKNGYAFFSVEEGTNTIVVSYLGGKREQTISVSDDIVYDFEFPIRDVKITVLDDKGNPLEAEVKLNNKTVFTDSQGVALIENIGGTYPQTEVIYKNLAKKPHLDLSVDTDYTIIFDFNAPKIKEVKVEQEEDITRLKMNIVDEGQYAGGVAMGGISVRYYLEGEWRPANVYSTGKGWYTAEIERAPLNTLVNFEITVEDEDGNKASTTGSYVEQEYTPENGGETPSEEPQEGGFQFDCVWVAGILVVAVIAYLLYKKFTSED